MKMFRLSFSAAGSERMLLIPFCLMASPFCAFIGYCLLTQWPLTGVVDQIIHSLVVDAFFTFAIFAGLGLIWGLFAPNWLARILSQTYGKVMLAIVLLAAGLLCMLVTAYLIAR
jgi:hypothetical protein